MSKEACIVIQTELADMMGMQFKEVTNWPQPFMRNHTVSFECFDADDYQCKSWSHRANKNINHMSCRIREMDAKCAVETSPARRTALRAFFDAREDLRGLNKNNFEECQIAVGRYGHDQDRLLHTAIIQRPGNRTSHWL